MAAIKLINMTALTPLRHHILGQLLELILRTEGRGREFVIKFAFNHISHLRYLDLITTPGLCNYSKFKYLILDIE